MMTFLKSTRWILLGAAVIVLVGVGTTAWIWYGNYRAWHNSQAAPLFAEIEPSDVAIIHGKEAWVRWNSAPAVEGRVLWREAGGLRVQVADAGKGQELLAYLGPLRFGKKYEYIAEQSADGLTQHSSVRSFVVQPGLAFDPPADQTVEHDYDQSVKLTLRNTSAQPITVTAKALKQFDDLPADITGYGSAEVPAKIAPNSTLELRLAVTAADAAHDTYEIPIEAAGAYVTARFRVKLPKLNLAFRVVDDDPKTLAKTVEVQNNGDTLTDLAVRAAPANQQDLELQPSAEHARLDSGGTLRFVVSPILYLEFESFKAQIDASAAGQTTHFPLEFKVPPGSHLIAFRSASTTSSSGNDWYCTNKPNTCSSLPGTKGNGPAESHSGQGDGGGTKDSLLWVPGIQGGSPVDQLLARNLVSPSLAFKSGSLDLRPTDRPKITMVNASDKQRLLLLAQAPVGAPGAAEVPTSGAEAPGNLGCHNPENPGATDNKEQPNCDICFKYKCSIEEYDSCISKAHDLLERYNAAADLMDLYLKEESVSEDVEHIRKMEDLVEGRIQKILMQYDDLRASCSKDCKIILPEKLSNPAKLPFPRGQFYPGDKADDARHKTALEQHDMGLPPNFPELSCEQQDQKIDWLDEAESRELTAEIEHHCAAIFTYAGVVFKIEGEGIAALCHIAEDFNTRYAKALRDLAKHDPPSFDFSEVVKPTFRPIVIPSNAPDTDRLGWEALDAQSWSLAYLQAWTESYERYQGAFVAGNREGMVLQAKAMVNFASQGLEASQAASPKWFEFQNASLEKLRPWVKSGIQWKEILDHYRHDRGGDGMPPKLREAMVAEGIPEADITNYSKEISELTAESAQHAFDRWRHVVEISAKEHELLMKENPHVVYPQPHELAVLLGNQRLSAILLRRALSTSNQEDASHREKDAPVLLRTGLLESIQRRGSFTRTHRGPIAAQHEGNGADSSNFAASRYSGERVYFAWHQKNDQVIFAGFDPAGKMVSEPHVIGKGRWPRLAADGNRVAVTWSSPDGNNFIVRLNDGKQWGSEIQLPGREAAIVFATGGPLYAATSTGLWKLNGDHFDRVQATIYSQPAITVDKEGKPHVAWQQNGRVVFDGSDVGEGERPSVVITSDGAVNLAYLSHGALLVRSGKGGQWSGADSIPAKNPSWPTLALDSAGAVRLSYIGAADFGPDALWLVRLPDKNPILMPSLAGNVTDAWFTVRFDLRGARNNYRRHDLLLTVNDVWVKMFENTVPEGRYLYRLNPSQVFTSPGQPVPNRVAIHSWHMNSGHYASNSDYQLVVRSAWSEHYVFSANENDARLSTTSARVNHNQPDLGIYANAADLPVEMPKPGRMDVPVLIANLGEAASAPTQLLMLGENNKVLATAAVPPLKPGADQTIKMPFDYDGKLTQLVFRFDKNVDFDPSNDSLSLTLWAPPPTGYVASQPTGNVGPQPGMPKVPVELTVKLFNDNTPPSSYRIVDASSGRMISKVVNGEQFASLPAGTYRVAVKPFPYEGQEVLFPDNIQHQAGVPQTVQLNSGIKLEAQSAGNIWQWSVVDPANPARIIQWQTGGHPLMALPPGEYQVAMQPTQFDSQPVVWPQKIQVQAGQTATFKPDSGVRLEMTQDMGPLWQWWLVSPSKLDQAIQRLNGGLRVMIVPPGEYQVAMQPTQFSSQSILWPQKIQVQAGQTATFKLDSGVRLEMTQDMGPLWQWWLVSPGKLDRAVQRQNGDQRMMVVPPGEYQVAMQPTQFDSQPVVWPQKIQVQPGQQVTFKLDSGIRLDMAQNVGPLWQWWLVSPGKPDQAVQRQNGDQRKMVVPPGEYQVAMQPIQFYSQPVVWPQKIQVQAGQIATFKLDSGVRLDMAQDMGPLWQWWLVSPGKPDQAVQRQNGDQRKMVVPPGEYQVAMQPIQFYSQPVVWPQKIQVQPGQQVTFKVSSGVRMIGPPGASPDFEFQFLNDQKQIAQWGQKTWNTQALPPGTYSLQIRRQFGQWKTVAEQVQVREGQIAEVHISKLPPQ